MRIHTCAQGSPEWHRARAGVCTASMFTVARSKTGGLTEQQQRFVNLVLDGTPEASAAAIAGYKAPPTADSVKRALLGERVGEFSAAARSYALQLAIERISGEPLQGDEFTTFAMRRGHELEPDARAAHEALGVLVTPVGFITTDGGWLGASTDGFISHNGAAEYKCLVSPEGLRAILLDDDLSAFQDQIQGGLMVAQREFMHFGLYCPALASVNQALTIRVVHRDDEYIEALRRDLGEFRQLVEETERKLIAAEARNRLAIAAALATID